MKNVNGKIVHIYTDGGALGNPGPGGYGVVLLYRNKRKELSGGYRLTTNNRMEMKAVIEGLKTLKFPCDVIIYSDSKYVVDSINKGWIKTWRSRGWRRKGGEVKNIDLWKEINSLCEKHSVKFKWIKGHTGNPFNERCDYLAKNVAKSNNLPLDQYFEDKLNKLGDNGILIF